MSRSTRQLRIVIALTVPAGVTPGADRRWLMARPGFENLTGLQPDFEFTQVLPITNDSSADFACGDPAKPENNDFESVGLEATVLCAATTSTTTTTLVGPPACGDANFDGIITATDALLALNTAVQTATCPLCRCDVDLSVSVTATDALRTLNAASGVIVSLDCPPC